MEQVVAVRFKGTGKSYYFDPGELCIAPGGHVVVETSRGMEIGTVTRANLLVPDEEVVKPLKKVLRIASKKDLKQMDENALREREAMEFCTQRIIERNLDMKLVGVECAFDNSRMVFYFTSGGRVDFRDLVKDLVGAFRTRIELRQIGVRDEARMIGGLGICGREFCCSSFLSEFQPVSIKMAKEQGLSLNPAKISGACGRLMCCLKYEQPAYEQLIRTTPKVGSRISTAELTGTVIEVALLTGMLKVRPDNDEGIKTIHKSEVLPASSPQPPKGEAAQKPKRVIQASKAASQGRQ
jgi:cell fate regulator YaaT (PSP1 superfamily)